MHLGLNKLPWYGAMLIAVAIGGAGMVSYHYLYAGFPRAFSEIVPIGESEGTLRASLAEKEVQLARERQDIQRGLDAERRLVDFREELKQLERQFNDLKVVLPDKRDVADMLRRIQTLATQSSLVVKVFRPQAVVSKQLHQEWPMALELDGTYHDLARFFDHVSKVPRIINVGSIAIKGKPSTNTVGDGTTITAQCTATTFVLLDKPGPATRKPGTIQRPGAAAPRAPATAQ
ncbi:MAG: type 4a pilus biogenesis protein PilO [Vicinamibacteraceae bacterium]